MTPCCLLHFLARQLLSVGVGQPSQWHRVMAGAITCYMLKVATMLPVRMVVCHTTLSKEAKPCNSLLTGLPFPSIIMCIAKQRQ